MTRSLYGEPDYVFGQRMLTLRTSIRLTQEGLAAVLGLTRKAIGRWEAGETYPKAAHLQVLLALALQHGAFVAGEEEEEIRAFWRAAHQRVRLDEAWLHELLSSSVSLRKPVPAEQSRIAEPLNAPSSVSKPRVDWGEALDVPSFYGREEELALLSRWIAEEGCRVVSVLGMGGIGKSVLAITVMQQVAWQFEVVIWRSLRDMPNCATLVQTCLQVLAPQAQPAVSDVLEDRLRLLMEQLRARRVLLVLDNWEILLEEGTGTGHLRADAPGYGQLLRHLGATRHQSCLLLTSREKLADLVPLEGKRSPVRALRLAGLDELAGTQLLEEKEVVGSPQDLERLVEVYRGNPLALKIVGQTIVELFGSEILPFLAQGELVFGGVRKLLDEQCDRLSGLELLVFYWLAILREPVGLEDLQAVLNTAQDSAQVLEALDGLLRRSLIERGQLPGSFTLQSVVLEYATGRLVAEVTSEIEQGRLTGLISYGLCQAQAKEYVRETQERLLVVPLLARLRSTYRRQADLEARLRSFLDDLRRLPQQSQGYGPANLIALLQGDLCGLDLSRLTLREAYLQGVQMQDTNLSGALIRDSVFTATFDAITTVATSLTGQYWAAGSRGGEVRVWRGEGQILHLFWQAHTDLVITLAFSPDERVLASGSFDGTIKLWDAENGALLSVLWSGWHIRGTHCNCLAFTSDGDLLASGGHDATVRLWNAKLGTLLQELPHPVSVISLAWSSDGRRLASGDIMGTIRLWERLQTGPARCVRTLVGHSNWVRDLAFAPDDSFLSSASWDGTVKLWELASGCCVQTLKEHTERVHCVAWSPDGGTLASGSFDHTIRLWDVQEGRYRAVLQGHNASVSSLAFISNSRHLLSGSDDGTLRLWEVEHGQCVRVLQGYAASLYDLDWSPDATQIASSGADAHVTVWEVASGMPRGMLRGHSWTVYGVGWSPDGKWIASSGWDNTIRLWEPATMTCVHVLRDLEHPDILFNGMAWSPDGELLACPAIGYGVLLWKVRARSGDWIGRELATWIRRVAWSPDGTHLIGGGDDGHVYMWDASDGTLLQRLAGHQKPVMSVAWSPDGSRLASGSGNSDNGELVVWDAQSGARLRDVVGHPRAVSAVTWDRSGDLLISGSSDGRLRWWDLHSGECTRVREAHQGTVQALKVSPDGSRLASCGDDGAIVLWDLQSGEPVQTLRQDRPYERLNITGIQGLTDAQKASLRALGAFEETSRGE